MHYAFQIYEDNRGETRFRFKAPNGQVMFSSQGYKRKSSAMKAIASIQKNAAAADIQENEAA